MGWYAETAASGHGSDALQIAHWTKLHLHHKLVVWLMMLSLPKTLSKVWKTQEGACSRSYMTDFAWNYSV